MWNCTKGDDTKRINILILFIVFVAAGIGIVVLVDYLSSIASINVDIIKCSSSDASVVKEASPANTTSSPTNTSSSSGNDISKYMWWYVGIILFIVGCSITGTMIYESKQNKKNREAIQNG